MPRFGNHFVDEITLERILGQLDFEMAHPLPGFGEGESLAGEGEKTHRPGPDSTSARTLTDETGRGTAPRPQPADTHARRVVDTENDSGKAGRKPTLEGSPSLVCTLSRCRYGTVDAGDHLCGIN